MRSHHKEFLAIATALGLALNGSGCSSKQQNDGKFICQTNEITSIPEILNNPESYNGIILRTRGYYHADEEETSIYTSLASVYNDWASGIWLYGLKEGADLTQIELDGPGYIPVYIEIVGRLEAGSDIGYGHVGQWKCQLVDITLARKITNVNENASLQIVLPPN